MPDMDKPVTAQEAVELKPCPFCGGRVSFTHGSPRLHGQAKNGIAIECYTCSLVFGWDCDYGGVYETKEAAAADWNDRPAQEAPRA
jgi:Lar family restriction alleviation protein